MNVNGDDFASGGGSNAWLSAEPGGHSNLEGANPMRTSRAHGSSIDFNIV